MVPWRGHSHFKFQSGGHFHTWAGYLSIWTLKMCHVVTQCHYSAIGSGTRVSAILGTKEARNREGSKCHVLLWGKSLASNSAKLISHPLPFRPLLWYKTLWFLEKGICIECSSTIFYRVCNQKTGMLGTQNMLQVLQTSTSIHCLVNFWRGSGIKL